MPLAQPGLAGARVLAASLTTVDYCIVGLYLASMLALGGLISTRIKAFKDYFLAGGELTTPLLVCTLVSSYYGIEVTFGTSETGFYYGLAAWFWYSLPYYFFITFAALVIAPRLRNYGAAMTLSDVVERHYGMSTRVVVAAACFLYSAPVLAMAGMMTLMQYLGLPMGWGLALTVGVCAVYTIMGGLWADALSDTVQFVLMCVSLAIVIPLALDWVGGWQFLDHLPNGAGQPAYMKHHGGLNRLTLAAWALTGLTILIEPAFYQRVFAASDRRAVPRALLVGIGLWASYDWGVTLVGMMARAAVEQGMLPADLAGREALLTLCMEMLPAGLRGLMIGGILAAAMSNVDTYSLLASGNIVYDIYRPLVDPHASDAQLLRMTRAGVFFVMIAAAIMSLGFARMRDMWQCMTSIMAGVALVPTMGALFARPKPAAGLGGALAGFAAVFTFYGILWTYGQYDSTEETHVLRLVGMEIWQDYAVMWILPASLLGYACGNLLGRQSYDANRDMA